MTTTSNRAKPCAEPLRRLFENRDRREKVGVESPICSEFEAHDEPIQRKFGTNTAFVVGFFILGQPPGAVLNFPNFIPRIRVLIGSER